jgi:hypothetical protein
MLVRLPRFARNHTRASGTHVFRHTLLRCCVNIQSRQIDGYMHRRPIFSSARFARHRTPHSFLDWGFQLDVAVGSTARKSYASNPWDGQEVSPKEIAHFVGFSSLPSVRQRDSSIPRPNMLPPPRTISLSTNLSFSVSYIASKSVTRLPFLFGSIRTLVPSLSSRRPP